MQYQVFILPVRANPPQVEETNRFLRSHRVLTVERRLVEEGQNSFWTKKYGEAFLAALAATEQKNPVPE